MEKLFFYDHGDNALGHSRTPKYLYVNFKSDMLVLGKTVYREKK